MPRVCDSTPNVLSIGRRVVLEGFEFHWPRFSQQPYLITPAGKHVYLEVDGYIPYLNPVGVVPVAAAGEEELLPLNSKIPGGMRRVVTKFWLANGDVVSCIPQDTNRYVDKLPSEEIDFKDQFIVIYSTKTQFWLDCLLKFGLNHSCSKYFPEAKLSFEIYDDYQG